MHEYADLAGEDAVSELQLVSAIVARRNELYKMIDSLDSAFRVVKHGHMFHCVCLRTFPTMQHLQYHVSTHGITMQMQMSHVFDHRMRLNAKVHLLKQAEDIISGAIFSYTLTCDTQRIALHLEELEEVIMHYRQVAGFAWFSNVHMLHAMICNKMDLKEIQQHIQLQMNVHALLAHTFWYTM